MLKPNYQGVIFDLDGTLMSSQLDFQAIRNAIGCPPQVDILAFVAAGGSHSARLLAKVVDFELADAEQASVLDGVLDTLDHFSALKLPMAIVTRNCRAASELKLARGKLPISLLLSREDAPAKPDPTALLQVASQWQLCPTQCLYVGDYLYDIQAASNAKMASCLYAPEEMPDYAHLADWRISDFRQLISIVASGV
ncbi:HAD family hydrolase [Pseudoalteromonas fenneropenaei]|uniref:HAD family hydrolase n=1 Tax=Pseudoalteromonas fenneropenaei TaxID=1737459 RepID=A0ABV7CJ01_9GAMM